MLAASSTEPQALAGLEAGECSARKRALPAQPRDRQPPLALQPPPAQLQRAGQGTEERRCSHCGVGHTSGGAWAREPATRALLCKACRQYQRNNGALPPPSVLQRRPQWQAQEEARPTPQQQEQQRVWPTAPWTAALRCEERYSGAEERYSDEDERYAAAEQLLRSQRRMRLRGNRQVPSPPPRKRSRAPSSAVGDADARRQSVASTAAAAALLQHGSAAALPPSAPGRQPRAIGDEGRDEGGQAWRRRSGGLGGLGGFGALGSAARGPGPAHVPIPLLPGEEPLHVERLFGELCRLQPGGRVAAPAPEAAAGADVWAPTAGEGEPGCRVLVSLLRCCAASQCRPCSPTCLPACLPACLQRRTPACRCSSATEWAWTTRDGAWRERLVCRPAACLPACLPACF